MSQNLHRLLALALLLAVVSGAVWVVDQIWFERYRFYSDNAAEYEERLKRYSTLAATRPALQRRLSEIGQDNSGDLYYLQQQAPNLAATELQQQIKGIVESNGGRLASTQILPTSDDSGFTRVSIRVQILVTQIPALQKTLYALESAKPILFIDNVQMRARTVRKRVATPRVDRRNRRNRRNQPRQAAPIKTETQLTAQFELSGYIGKGGAS